MSVHVYHEGCHPGGYLGIRIVVGSGARDDTVCEHIAFKDEHGEVLDMSARKSLIDQANQREKQLKAERGGDYRLHNKKTHDQYKSKKYSDLETNIRGLFILFLAKKGKLASGVGYYPTCLIVSEYNGNKKTFSMRHYERFPAQWEAAIRHHAEKLGMKRVGKGWRNLPISETVFKRHINRILKTC